MSERPNPYASYELTKPLVDFGIAVEAMGLDRTLIELVKIRASQVNGCAMCLYYHVNDARKFGETEMRLHMLAAWRESALYSPRERAALAWTEALTSMNKRDEADAWAAVAAQFEDNEVLALNLLIGVINAFNRLNVGFAVSHPAVKQAA